MYGNAPLPIDCPHWIADHWLAFYAAAAAKEALECQMPDSVTQPFAYERWLSTIYGA